MSSCGSPPSGSACARRRCAARGRRGWRRPPRRPDAAAERERALADCIAKIRRRGQRGEERRLRDEIRTAEARGDAAAVEAAMRRLKQLMDEAQAEKART